jgi:hypothetical protein
LLECDIDELYGFAGGQGAMHKCGEEGAVDAAGEE